MAKKMKKKKSKMVKPELDQVIFDENGYRIGDDGYPMTRPRRRLHATLNAMLIWGYICIVIAVVCVLAAFFQNQSFTPTEFIYYGGNEYNGYSIATLLRFEALCTFIAGLMAIALSHRCFNWLYDKGDDSILAKFYISILVIAGGWNMYLIGFVHLADPATLLLAIFAFSMLWFMVKVKSERRTLRPSVPASAR
ncbi:MAG: hypothetical protein ACI4UY_05070 [Kiritimatiellia bacterium]